ncbi:hypothetical protein AGOR_G00235500 [Albula goreensis]|uniref:diphosphoinositol-polyphosphate diphosphatase n=1 Tax=Albula goreensis TaxID=1534307 RepID=A0A8T3CL18_9TELE|nr:hypothetical protein AGOR_G00235500 [Albula goreensis]
MKFKPNQTRTYDGEGFKKRAACLCFRNEQEDEVLLVSSSRHPDQWIVPGGGMEPEEEPCGAAVREVYEEAGVKGKLGRLLGVFEQNQDRKHRTYVYVLTVTETWRPGKTPSTSVGSRLRLACSPTNGNALVPSRPDDNRSLYVTSTQGPTLPPSRR